jgi:hypothetical protein
MAASTEGAHVLLHQVASWRLGRPGPGGKVAIKASSLVGRPGVSGGLKVALAGRRQPWRPELVIQGRGVGDLRGPLMSCCGGNVRWEFAASAWVDLAGPGGSVRQTDKVRDPCACGARRLHESSSWAFGAPGEASNRGVAVPLWPWTWGAIRSRGPTLDLLETGVAISMSCESSVHCDVGLSGRCGRCCSRSPSAQVRLILFTRPAAPSPAVLWYAVGDPIIPLASRVCRSPNPSLGQTVLFRPRCDSKHARLQRRVDRVENVIFLHLPAGRCGFSKQPLRSLPRDMRLPFHAAKIGTSSWRGAQAEGRAPIRGP